MLLTRRSELSVTMRMLSGATAGAMATFVSQPSDAILTRPALGAPPPAARRSRQSRLSFALPLLVF